MILLTLATAALALPPDGTPGRFPVGNGYIGRMASSVEGDLVAGRDKATLTGWLLDVDTWQAQSNLLEGECEVTGVAIVDYVGLQELWFSCGAGTVVVKSWDGTTLSAADGLTEPIEVDDALSGIWYYNDPDLGVAQLYALYSGDSETRVHVLDLFGDVDASTYGTWPQTSPRTGFGEAVISGDQLIINNENNNMSRLQLPDGPLSLVTFKGGADLAINVVDISPSINGVYAVGSAGNMAELIWSVPTWTQLFTGLIDPSAVVANFDPDDPWIVITGEQIKVWQMDASYAIIGDNDDPYWESAPDADSKIQDAIVRDNYLFGGGVGGNLHVGTARPWVYPAVISVDPAPPTQVTSGDTVTLSFTADISGDYEIYRGGDRFGVGGDLLADGSVTEDTEEVVELQVDLSWEEGNNKLYVIVTHPVNKMTGHAAAVVDVDNPPRPPELTDANLDFGDGELFLRFEGIPDADLSYYEVYMSETEWDEADWQDYVSGGPPFEGTAGIQRKDFPIIIDAAGGEAVDKTLKPLVNYVKYYVGVRAVDVGGLVGPMSNEISEKPRPTFTAADLAYEKGGGPCSTAGQTAGWMSLLVGFLALARRRAGGASAAALVMLVALGAGSAAHAQDDERKALRKDLTPTYGNFEVRYGGIKLEDRQINRVYKDNPTNILQVEFGPQFFRVVELDVGIGFFQELAYTIDSNGTQSGIRTMLTWYPFALDGSIRAQFLDEQLLVPFVRGGFDYILWSEKWDSGGDSKNVLRGSKFGNHTGFGVNLLLDAFAKERASLLEVTSGINDSYLVFEWRTQRVDQRDRPWAPAPTKVKGFDFSGSLFTIGLKLDY